MAKTLAVVTAAAAFVVALYLVLRRRQAPRGRTRFSLLVAGFVALLGGGQTRAEPPRKDERPAAGKSEAALAAHAEWKAVRDAWHGVTALKQPGYDGLQKAVDAGRDENGKRLDRLVKAGLVDRAAADVLNAIYADRIYHHLRKTAATCYDPTELGARVQTTREQLEQRLVLLRKHHGKLGPATAGKVERALQKEMEILLQVEALWKKQRGGNWSAHRKEEQRIVALFAGQTYSKSEIKDSIKIRPGVAGAMRLVRLIYR